MGGGGVGSHPIEHTVRERTNAWKGVYFGTLCAFRVGVGWGWGYNKKKGDTLKQ